MSIKWFLFDFIFSLILPSFSCMVLLSPGFCLLCLAFFFFFFQNSIHSSYSAWWLFVVVLIFLFLPFCLLFGFYCIFTNKIVWFVCLMDKTYNFWRWIILKIFCSIIPSFLMKIWISYRHSYCGIYNDKKNFKNDILNLSLHRI